MSGGLAGKTFTTTDQEPRDRTGLSTAALAHSWVHFLGSHTRVEQEDREPTSNSSPVGTHADSRTDAELDEILSPQIPMIDSCISQTLQQLQETLRDTKNSAGKEQ